MDNPESTRKTFLKSVGVLAAAAVVTPLVGKLSTLRGKTAERNPSGVKIVKAPGSVPHSGRGV